MKRASVIAVLALFSLAASGSAFAKAQSPNDNDQTLHAMRDEMARSKARLELRIPDRDQPVRPYYVEYRLLDLDEREVVAEFGTLLSSTRRRIRFMNVAARVGTYKLDSSNFISEDAFRGFIGSTGSVGIDRDYNSLRQDLWIATDQAFKEAVETYSRKQAYLSSLARQSDIDDFSRAEAIQHVEPLVAPITRGQRVGLVKVTLDAKPVGEYPLVALEEVPLAGLFGRAWDTIRLWFK